MIEIDGPQTAWFQDTDGTRYTYTCYALGTAANDAGELLQLYQTWYNGMKQSHPNCMLVWRRRPVFDMVEFDSILDNEGHFCRDPDFVPYWKLTFRCVFVPCKTRDKAFPIRLEGAPVERL